MNNLINVGKIVATFGLQGQIILKHALGKKCTLKNIETIFIEITKGNKIPYFITSSSAKNTDEIYIQIEGTLTKEAAHKFIAKQVWLLEDDFRQLAGKQSAISMLGYSILQQNETLGTVLEVIEQPHQILLSTQYKGNHAYIPLHEETLIKISHKTKQIFVQLPEGLLDIYV